MTEEDGGTFTREDIQAWIDTLGPREQAMLAWTLGDAEYRAAVQSLGAAAEFVADLARQHGAAGKRKASRAVREVVGVLLRVKREAEAAGAEHAGQQPEGMH